MAHQNSQDKHKNRGLSALPIGIVSAMIGYVAIKGTDGIEKIIKLGEKLFSHDEIVTGENSHAVIDLIDGSKINLNSDSNIVLDEDVIDAQMIEQIQQAILAGIYPAAGGEQNDGGFDISRVDIQEQINADATDQNDSDSLFPFDTGLADGGLTPSDNMPGEDIPGNDPVTPPDAPEPPENPIGKIPSLSIADVVVIEPPPAGNQGEQGGQGGSDTHGSEEGHDTGSDSGSAGGGSDAHGSDEGHDTGSEHGSDEGGHDTSSPTYAVFTIALSAPALTDVTVDYTTANGTAISGGRGVNENDFGHTQGTLTIPRGETTGTIQVEILGDRGVESDNEYFYVNLSNAQGASIADGQAIGRIIDSGHGEGSTGEGETLIGTDDNDELTGSGGRDTIYGEGGDDIINGRGGPDTLFGGEGNDNIQGMGGPDTMSGGPGNDVMSGHGGRDVMDGGSGDDTMDGGGGPDTIIGGEGDDILIGGGGPDLVEGGPGNDTIYGDGGPDTLIGGTGDDIIYGGGSPDTLTGSDGNDTLYGDGGSDILDGGLGSDILVGGGAGDIFRFDNFDAIDSIIDFKPQQGDVIDISALIEDFNVNDPITNYVQLTQTAEPNTFELMVNPTGSTLDDFQLLVTLENFQHSTSLDDLVDNGNLILSDLV